MASYNDGNADAGEAQRRRSSSWMAEENNRYMNRMQQIG
jgi:hypothetical protein